MRHTRLFAFHCSFFTLLVLLTPQVEATTYTWNGASATNGNMTNTGNWVGGSAWVSGAHDVVISAQGNWATINNDNAANTGMHSLTYNAGVPTLSLNGNQIAINQGASPNSIVNNSGNVQNIGAVMYENVNAITITGGAGLNFNSGFLTNVGNTITTSGPVYWRSYTTAASTWAPISNSGTLTIASTSGQTDNAGITNTGSLVFGDANNENVGISGAISGAGTVAKNGTGTLTLSSTGTNYSGATSINQGTLVLSGATGYASSTTTATSTLELTSTNTAVDNWRINTILAGAGTINKTGSGWIQTNTNAHTFSGTFNVQQGTFGASFLNSNWTGVTADFNISSGALLDARGQAITVGSLNDGTGAGTVGTTWTTAATLNVGAGNKSGSFSGSVTGNATSGTNNTSNPNAGALSLVKNGTGTQVLSGTNTYTGNTTVSQGTLALSGSNSLGSSSIFVAPPSSGSATLNVLSGASISAANMYLFQDNKSNATATLNQSGGTVTLTSLFQPGASFAGGNSGDTNIANFTGGTFTAPTIHLYKWATTALNLSGPAVVNATTLDLGWVDSSPTGSIDLGNGVTFSGGTNINDGGTSGILNVGSFTLRSNRNYTLSFKGGTLKASAGSGSWLQAGQFTSATVQDAGGIIDNGGNAITIAQILSHGGTNPTDGGLVFKGSGTTTLSNANGFNGGATISQGTLALSNATAAGSAPITLGNASTGVNNIQLTLSTNPANNIIVSNNGTGTATIFGNVQFGSQSGTIALNRATIFQIPNTGTGDWWYNFGSAGGITGSGPLTIKGGGGAANAGGAGNRIFMNAGTGFTGGTTVESGAVQIGAVNGAGTNSITLGNANTGSGVVAQLRVGANLTNNIVISSAANAGALPGIGTFNTLQVLSGALQIDHNVELVGASDRLTWSGSVWSGSGNITISGGRVTHDSATNTWTGNMTINPGSTFQAANNSSLIASNSVTVNGTLRVISSGAGGTVMINALNGSGGVNGDTGGSNNLKTLSVGNNGGSGSFSGAISNGSGGDTLAITKAGAGTQTLSGASTYSGATSITNGTLSLSGSLTGSSVMTSSTGIMSQTATGSIAGGSGAFTQGSSGTSILGGTNTYGGTTTVNNGILQITGTASNTTLGNTNVNNGELQMGKTAGFNAIGSSSLFVGDGIGAAASAIAKLLLSNQIPDSTDVIIYSDGKFDLNSRDETINNLLDGSPAGGTVDGTSGTPTFTVASGSFSGTITDTAGTLKLVKNTSGNLLLTGVNTYAGATDIQQGILAIGAGNDRLPITTTVTLGNGTTSGKLRLSELSSPTARNQTLSGLLTSGTGTTNRVVGGAAGTSVLTVNIASGTDTYGGFLGGPSTNENNLALTKTGVGTLTLTANNTYLGVTNVNGGTLALNGTHTPGAGAGLYTVNNGGTLKGSGITNGNLAVLAGGKVAPGNSIESLGVGDILFNGGTFQYEIDSSENNLNIAADLLYGDDTSTLTLTGSPILTLVELGSGGVPLGTKFTLIAYDGAWNNGTFVGHADDSKFFFSGNRWLINYNDTSAGSNFVSNATSFGTAFVTIEAVPVPEPSSYALGMMGVIGLALLAWRRRK